MSEIIQLYPTVAPAAVENTTPKERDVNCTACKFHAPAGRACLPDMAGPGGGVGGILVVFESPTVNEMTTGRSFSSPQYQMFLRVLSELAGRETWRAAYALGCPTPRKGMKGADTKRCRPYLASILEETQPRVVIAAGPLAVEGVTGRKMDNITLRGGYSWLTTGMDHVPVHYVSAPWLAAANRFARQWLRDDLTRAIQGPIPVKPPYGATTEVVSTEEQSLAFEAIAMGADYVTFDCETTGIQFHSDFRVISIACSLAGSDRSWVWDDAGLQNFSILNPLLRVLGGPVPKGGQNIKYDMRCVRAAWDVEVGPVAFDTRYWMKLINSESDADLDTLNEKVGMGGHKAEATHYLADAVRCVHSRARAAKELEKKGLAHDSRAIRVSAEPKAYAYGMMPRVALLRYNALDTLATQHAAEKLRETLGPVKAVWKTTLARAVSAFEQMESWGMPVSMSRLRFAHHHFQTRLQPVMQYFNGIGINPSSDAQLRTLLFGKLGLKPGRKTETGLLAVDKELLESLRGQHEIVDHLLEYRLCSKLDGTYAKGLMDAAGADGRIHPSFNLDGAATGRTSCSDPNLQNIPSTDRNPVEGKMIKDCFAATEGMVLVQADYSQLELRIAADLSGDPDMLAIFSEGVDYHLRTAQMVALQVWGKRPEDVGKAERRFAKTINFGLLYGATDGANAMALDCSVALARQVREAIFGKMKQLVKWVDKCKAQTSKTGQAWTWWNGKPYRCRNLYQVGVSQDSPSRLTAERGSWNTPVQGTASEFCVVSVTEMIEWIKKTRFPAKVICTVHDSIISEVREDMVEAYSRKLKAVMGGWPTNSGVELVTDFDLGPAWGSMEKYLLPEEHAAELLKGSSF